MTTEPSALPDVLTIDGPSGSGKGTIARRVAAILGWNLLDSGALYRLTALAAGLDGIALTDATAISAIAEGLEVEFGSGPDGDEEVRLRGVDAGRSGPGRNGPGRERRGRHDHGEVEHGAPFRSRTCVRRTGYSTSTSP